MVLSSEDTLKYFEERYNDCTIRYGDMKKQLAEDVIAFTTPIREKIMALMSDDEYLRKIARLGREKARASAGKTVSDIRHIIGFKEF
jgi:tryptophanyl-tRNA synthetase